MYKVLLCFGSWHMYIESCNNFYEKVTNFYIYFEMLCDLSELASDRRQQTKQTMTRWQAYKPSAGCTNRRYKSTQTHEDKKFDIVTLKKNKHLVSWHLIKNSCNVMYEDITWDVWRYSTSTSVTTTTITTISEVMIPPAWASRLPRLITLMTYPINVIIKQKELQLCSCIFFGRLGKLCISA